MDELINICLQANSIHYWQYDFDGIESCKDFSLNLKMGYTMAEETGLYEKLEELGVTSYFDFEKYGESYSYSHELLENGYLTFDDCDIDFDMYSEDEIQEEVNQILKRSNEMERRKDCTEELYL